MVQKTLFIQNKYGIHARPSSMISELAQSFDCSIILKKDGRVADAKNIMSLILLCAEPGSKIELEITGSDEEKALQAFIDLIEVRKFDEELSK